MTFELTPAEQQNLDLLRAFATDIAFLRLTGTGLRKSILDAVLPLRTLLHENGLHDFAAQPQGAASKAELQALFLEDAAPETVPLTLYRPDAKKGDPRLWFSRLNRRAQPGDTLALFVAGGTLHVLNLTRSRLAERLREGDATDSTRRLAELADAELAISRELLARLRALAAAGPLPAVGTGSTAVGRTVETALGLAMNSDKGPDYKGIELKASRLSVDDRATDHRSNLFAQVPDWSVSRYKSIRELLETFGYARDGGRYALHCTVAFDKPNAQGLQLRLAREQGLLIEHHVPSSPSDVIAWRLQTLHARLLDKHRETFWIGADAVTLGGKEHFVLKSVRHTRRPSTAQFDELLEQGHVSLDHLISRSASGQATEKGPLFKLPKKHVPALFLAETREYTLTP